VANAGPSVLVGLPNLAAIRVMLAAYGYRVERLSDWAGLLHDNPGTKDCDDYANGRRITVRCVNAKAAPGAQPAWKSRRGNSSPKLSATSR
jgi:hypothetical protein